MHQNSSPENRPPGLREITTRNGAGVATIDLGAYALIETDHPYGGTAWGYRAAGWTGVLPLPFAKKSSPPDDYTGRFGIDPDDEQIRDWCKTYPGGNIALRMPDNIIGIDVDDYGDKPGGTSIWEAELRWGPLPDSPRSSARPYPSGIKFFRVPSGAHFVPTLDKPLEKQNSGVDIVQHGHRYAVVFPSVHPDVTAEAGSPQIYWWYDVSGAEMNTIPAVHELPLLPLKWRDKLSTPVSEATQITSEAVTAFYASLVDPHGKMCLKTRMASYRYRNEFVCHRWSGNRHDAAMHMVHDLQHLGAEGHHGIFTGLDLIHQGYLLAKTSFEPIRQYQASEGEWERLVYGATGVGIVLAKIASGEITRRDDCGCEETEIPLDQSNETLPWLDEPESVQRELKRLLARDRAAELYDQLKEIQSQQDGDEEFFEVTDWDTVEEEASPPLILSGLLYQRGTLWISGAGGSGKTWLAYWILAELARQEHTVIIYECESGPAMIKGRLLNLGLTVDQIKAHVRDYRSPDGNTSTDLKRHGKTLAAQMRKDGAMAALFDAAAPLLLASRMDEDSSSDVRDWVTQALRPVTNELGALALVIDHTGHADRMRPRGSSDKKPANDAMWVVETRRAFAIGQDGQVQLTATKDRWGRIGENATCQVNVMAGADESVTFLPFEWRVPKSTADFTDAFDGVEDTTEMRILTYLGMQNRPCTSREIKDGTGLDKNQLQAALGRLRKAGKINAENTTTRDGRAVYAYKLPVNSDAF